MKIPVEELMFEDEYDAQYEGGMACDECGEHPTPSYQTNCVYCGRSLCYDCAFYVGNEVACEGCFLYPEGW